MNSRHKLPGLRQLGTSSPGLWSAYCGLIVMVVATLSAASTVHGQGTYQVVTAFDAPLPDGSNPSGSLIQAGDGSFYGTTSRGGASGNGTVFKIDAAGTLMTLHRFGGSDGANPS